MGCALSSVHKLVYGRAIGAIRSLTERAQPAQVELEKKVEETNRTIHSLTTQVVQLAYVNEGHEHSEIYYNTMRRLVIKLMGLRRLASFLNASLLKLDNIQNMMQIADTQIGIADLQRDLSRDLGTVRDAVTSSAGFSSGADELDLTMSADIKDIVDDQLLMATSVFENESEAEHLDREGVQKVVAEILAGHGHGPSLRGGDRVPVVADRPRGRSRSSTEADPPPVEQSTPLLPKHHNNRLEIIEL
jgi:hypothetical protein